MSSRRLYDATSLEPTDDDIAAVKDWYAKDDDAIDAADSYGTALVSMLVRAKRLEPGQDPREALQALLNNSKNNRVVSKPRRIRPPNNVSVAVSRIVDARGMQGAVFRLSASHTCLKHIIEGEPVLEAALDVVKENLKRRP